MSRGARKVVVPVHGNRDLAIGLPIPSDEGCRAAAPASNARAITEDDL